MSVESCPKPEVLFRFSTGRLDEVQAAPIVDHLEACASCCEILGGHDSQVDHKFPSLEAPSFQHANEGAYRSIEPFLRHLGTDLGAHEDSVVPAGTQLGPYRILERLGEGGMGVVYKVEHIHLKKQMALKILPAALHRHENFRKRFEREVLATGSIDHPNIVTSFDAGEYDGHPFLAMELLRGANLAEVQERSGCLPVPEACEVIRQTAIGLESIHQLGMLHRDIKPSNLMLSQNEQGETIIKILDLGLARLETDYLERSTATNAGQILGTLEFMAPEQADDARSVDARADIYSMGATLYKLLTGEGPFSTQKYNTPLKMLSAIANVQPALVGRLVDVPQPLGELIDRMLSRDPADRPESARTVAKALTRYSSGTNLGQLLARPPANLADTVTIAAQETVAQQVETNVPQSNDSRRATDAINEHPPNRKGLVLASFLFLFILLAAGIIWLKMDGGYLRIESPADMDITVDVLRDGEFVES
ncbi:MAG: serine/threonine protein kinase, partial [Planctomycetaceae bacterium]|nr:serine/threonine protein kinase [Planctomycetaceae bacterium]